jgi:hypothetical protein
MCQIKFRHNSQIVNGEKYFHKFRRVPDVALGPPQQKKITEGKLKLLVQPSYTIIWKKKKKQLVFLISTQWKQNLAFGAKFSSEIISQPKRKTLHECTH